MRSFLGTFWSRLLYLLNEIESHKNPDKSDWHRYYTLGLIYAKLNDKDHAFRFFDKAFEARHSMAQIKVHPQLDNLRSAPALMNCGGE